MVAVAIVALTGVACSDATGPGASLTVTVSVDQVYGPFTGTVQDSIPTLGCKADVRAIAHGTGKATWLDASVRWFGGIGKATLIDSAVVSAANIESAWGKPWIAVGDSERSTWTLSAGMPFKSVIQYHYQSAEGAQGTAEVTVDCGPTAPTGSPPPSITQLLMHTSSDDLEPGDTLGITYTASGAAGLWETIVRLSGPCQAQRIIPDSLHNNMTRTVLIPVPHDCQLGVPITATVIVVGVGLQSATRSVTTSSALVDRTPPRINPGFFPPAGGPEVLQLTGDYFTGDSIRLQAGATDNHALHALIWEFLPSGVKDSLILTGASDDSIRAIPIPNGVTGPIQLRLYARDAVGLTSDTIIAPQTGSVAVHPTIERPTKWTTVPGAIQDVAIDAQRGLVYLLETSQHQLAVLSLATMTITATAPLPLLPTRLDLTASGDTLVVFFAEAAVGIMDVRQLSQPPSIIQLPGYDPAHPHGMLPRLCITTNGKAFVSLLAPVTGQMMLAEVDLATGAQRIRTDAGDGGLIGGGGGMARSLDHSVVVISGGATYLQRYDAGTNSFGPRLSPVSSTDQLSLSHVSVDASGRRSAIGLDVYDASLQFLHTMNAQVLPGVDPGTAMSAAGDVAYEISWPEGIVRASVDDEQLLDRTPNPIRPQMLRVSDDGTMLVTIEHQFGATSSNISVIDLR